MQRVIVLANGKQIPLGKYVEGIKRAKANHSVGAGLRMAGISGCSWTVRDVPRGVAVGRLRGTTWLGTR